MKICYQIPYWAYKYVIDRWWEKVGEINNHSLPPTGRPTARSALFTKLRSLTTGPTDGPSSLPTGRCGYPVRNYEVPMNASLLLDGPAQSRSGEPECCQG